MKEIIRGIGHRCLLYQRRAVDGDFVAELADFDVADDEDGFVFAQFGLAGDKQRAVVHVGRRGVAGQEFEVGVAVAAAVDVDAFAVGEVEIYFDHAAFFVFAGDVRLEGADFGGVFGADDAEQVAEGRRVGGVGFDAFGQGAGVFFRVGAADAEVGGGLVGGVGGGDLVGDFAVVIGVVVGNGGGIAGDQAKGGGVGADGGL